DVELFTWSSCLRGSSRRHRVPEKLTISRDRRTEGPMLVAREPPGDDFNRHLVAIHRRPPRPGIATIDDDGMNERTDWHRTSCLRLAEHRIAIFVRDQVLVVDRQQVRRPSDASRI